MKITVLAGYYPPEQSADSRLNQDLAEGLSQNGMDVTFVVPFPSRGVTREEQIEYLDKCDEQCSAHLRIIRVGSPGAYHRGLFRRGIDFLMKSFRLYCTAKKTNADAYLVISTPPFLGYVAALLAAQKPVVYKLQDVFPDSLIHSKNLTESNLAVKFLRRLERWVYSHVTEIIACSEDMKSTLISRGVSAQKISVVFDWVDEKKCYPIAKRDNPFFEKFNLPLSGFYVCYAGNIGLLQNLGTVVRAAEILEKRLPQIKFIIIGDGAWKPRLEELLRKAGHENVFLFPMQPLCEIAAVYSLGDVGLVSLKPEITRFALPSKTWNILAAGRPAVCEIDVDSSLSELLRERHIGFCVSPNDAEAMAACIAELYEHPDERISMGQSGREYIERHLTRQAAIEKYCSRLRAAVREEQG